MAIANKFLHFKTKAGFLNKIKEYVTYNETDNTYTPIDGKTDDWNMFRNYTAFIQDTHEIWTHENFYKCDVNEEDVEKLITEKGYITEADIPSLTGGANATSGQYVSGVTVSGHQINITKGNLPQWATSAPEPIDTYARIGSSAKYAREDHIHTVNIDKIGEFTPGYRTSFNIPNAVAPYIGAYMGDVLCFPNKEDLTHEISSNGGESWEPLETRTDLFMFQGKQDLYCTPFENIETVTVNHQYRLTYTVKNRYASLYWFYIYFSTNGVSSTVTIERKSGEIWETLIDQATVAGWSGPNYYSLSDSFAIATNEDPSNNKYNTLRFTFKITKISERYSNKFGIYRIAGFGKGVWTAANNIMRNNQIYDWDYSQNVTFPATVTATSLITDGGNNTQVVRGDGTLQTISSLVPNNAIRASKADRWTYDKTLNLTNGATGTVTSNWSETDINLNVTGLNADYITSGTIGIERLPKGALERLVIVDNQAARYKLTTSDVQEGDTVKQNDTGVMYFVVDTTNLSNENGYKVYTAGSATSVPWSGVTSKPTTIAGYGITDVPKVKTVSWTNGTSNGPTGTIAGDNMNNVSVPAIPIASSSTSGVITTSAQTIAGDKTFTGSITTNGGVRTNNIGPNNGESLYFGYDMDGTGKIYIGPDGDYNFGTTGGEYSGNAATASKVKGTLSFTGSTVASYNGSEDVQVYVPDLPSAMPNPYPLVINGESYDGNQSVTVNTQLDYQTYTYNNTTLGTAVSSGITPNVCYYPSLYTSTTSALTIYIRANAFNASNSSAVIVVYGTRSVTISSSTSYGSVLKQKDLITTGTDSSSYRIYCVTYLGGSGTSTRVAVNCSEYTI